MITLRPSEERGRVRLGWLDSRHSFSFGEYHDEKWMGYRSLRVINDDVIAPSGGFPTHPHRDMEIISIVLDGALEHRDSLGTGSVIHPGDVQRMTAGRGVAHSEFNPSSTEPMRLLQIWILPRERRLEPSYDQKKFPRADRIGKWRTLVSADGEDGSIVIQQDARLLASAIPAGQSLSHEVASGRGAWVHVISGQVRLRAGDDERTLGPGDAAAVDDVDSIEVKATQESDVLLFDLK